MKPTIFFSLILLFVGTNATTNAYVIPKTEQVAIEASQSIPDNGTLCCMLYLEVINSTQTYTDCQVISIESENHAAIEDIKSNAELYQQVVNEYSGEASGIVIIPTDFCD